MSFEFEYSIKGNGIEEKLINLKTNKLTSKHNKTNGISGKQNRIFHHLGLRLEPNRNRHQYSCPHPRRGNGGLDGAHGEHGYRSSAAQGRTFVLDGLDQYARNPDSIRRKQATNGRQLLDERLPNRTLGPRGPCVMVQRARRPDSLFASQCQHC